MKERPILFSEPMVRAILEGRKTQTRRIVQVQPPSGKYQLTTLADSTARKDKKHIGAHHWAIVKDLNIVEDHGEYFRCPYGYAGDHLWVRETWRAVERDSDLTDGILFASGGHFQPIPETQQAAELWMEAYGNGKHGESWRPSIFMPRWASRITLEITGVRVERLNTITIEDIIAEGLSSHLREHDACCELKDQFAALWDSINSKRASWKSNPWVWVIEFKRLLV